MNKLFVILLATAIVSCATSVSVKKRPFHTIDFDHYWTLDEIQEYFEDLVEDFPNLASIEEHGRTSEGRVIQAFVVRKGAPKDTIVIESGLRSREWLGPMSALYFIHELVEHDYEFEDILDRVDLVFIPVANPDGYVYSHHTDRFWNKNRRPVSASCNGVDLNRNFQYAFHATSDPCSENFSGPFFHSEAETLAIRDVLSSYQDRVKMYLSLQAFGQQIAIPYNYFAVGTQNQAALQNLAAQAANAIRSAPGQRAYTVGVGGILNGVEGGTSLDFAYESRRIPLSFTLRLPSGGSTGWDVPENQLPAILSETFRGFLVFAQHVASSS